MNSKRSDILVDLTLCVELHLSRLCWSLVKIMSSWTGQQENVVCIPETFSRQGRWHCLFQCQYAEYALILNIGDVSMMWTHLVFYLVVLIEDTNESWDEKNVQTVRQGWWTISIRDTMMFSIMCWTCLWCQPACSGLYIELHNPKLSEFTCRRLRKD